MGGAVLTSVSPLSNQIAKVEKLKPLEVELRRLEDLSESIVNDFAYMKKREEEMRDTNGEVTPPNPQPFLVIPMTRPLIVLCFYLRFTSVIGRQFRFCDN